ncbi:helix-turn-helix domain-containing protein [Streptoverticillium reticulum]|uniref:helix-turn-helix domain-containing protein n=1 Tax=Streptoverticillium reticulum TaxID=1433415 RepID=UPI0039BEF306
MPTRRRLAMRRRALGYSQEELAEMLGVDRTSVGRWERGEADPQPHNRPKLASFLKVTLSELDALLSTKASWEIEQPVTRATRPKGTFDRAAADHLGTGDLDDMIRRDFLRLLTITSTLISLPNTADSRASDTTHPFQAPAAEDFNLMNAHLWQVFSLAKNKRSALPLVREQLSTLNSSMRSAGNQITHRQLCTAAGDAFQLAGEIFFDSNRYTDAAHCYSLAASASREAGSPDLWACALTRHAFIGMHERNFKDAVPILSAAANIARRGDSQLSTRHWVAAVQAEAFAGIGDLDSCKRALDEAEQVHALSGQVHNGGWLRFDGSRLAEERGTCYVELGRPDLAEAALTEALSQNLSARRKGSVLTGLASLGVQRRDTEQALGCANAAIELAHQTGSGYVARKLNSLRAQLESLMPDSRVSQLVFHISTLNVAG